MKKILIIGSINMDMAAEVDHTPVAGETILTDSVKLVPGGKGAGFCSRTSGGRCYFSGSSRRRQLRQNRKRKFRKSRSRCEPGYRKR